VKDLPAPRGKDNEAAIAFWSAFAFGLVGGFLFSVMGINFGLAFVSGILAYVLFWVWRYRLQLIAHRAYKTHQYEESLELLQRAITKNPSISSNYVSAAAASLQMRKPADAVQYCDRAIGLAPKNAVAFQSRANAYLRSFDGARALADANESIRLKPNAPTGYLLRATAYNLLHKYNEAISDCNFLIDRKKNLNGAHTCRAIANLNLNKLESADEDCDFVIDQIIHKPSADELAYVLLVKGVIQSRRLQFEEALANFAHSRELRPAIQSNFIERANAFCGSGNFQEALSELDKLETQECSEFITAFALINRARIYLRKSELEDALKYAEAATNMFQNIPTVLASYGLILTRAGQLEKAQTILDKAISLDPYYAEAYWFRHEMYEKMGESEKAKADKQVAEGYDYKPYI